LEDKVVARILATTFIALLAAFSCARAAEVRLRSSAGCAGAVVRVADVAELVADDPRVAGALGDIVLCPAPASGAQRTLSQAEVQQLLALSGVDRQAALVRGSESVTITFERATAHIIPAKRPMVAAGVHQAAFELAAGESSKTKVRTAPKSPPTPPAEQKPAPQLPDVERGTIVTVSARTAGVKITTTGKALEAGAVGASIGVELADTKQRVRGRVTGPQAVEVVD
jgi:hypothetical protein